MSNGSPITYDTPRMIYIFRPGCDAPTCEPEYVILENKVPIGSYLYDPHEDNPSWRWSRMGPTGQSISDMSDLPKHLRAWQLILPVPT
jgi:hypothetical protein